MDGLLTKMDKINLVFSGRSHLFIYLFFIIEYYICLEKKIQLIERNYKRQKL